MLVKSECATSGQKNKIQWVFNFYQMNNLHSFITITSTMVHESAGVIFEYSELSEELGLHSKFSVCLKSGRDEKICVTTWCTSVFSQKLTTGRKS